MNTYEVRAPSGALLLSLEAENAKATLDRTTGTLALGEATKAGALKPKGARVTCGYDPLAEAPALLRIGPRGGRTETVVPERGEPHPSEVVMGDG